MGQVMPVPMCIRLVCVARAPSHVHVNAAWPPSLHGWKWSLTSGESKPAFSASMAFWSSAVGGNCSVPALYPNWNGNINLLQSRDEPRDQNTQNGLGVSHQRENPEQAR